MPFKGAILDVAVDWISVKLDFEWFVLPEDINVWIFISTAKLHWAFAFVDYIYVEGYKK